MKKKEKNAGDAPFVKKAQRNSFGSFPCTDRDHRKDLTAGKEELSGSVRMMERKRLKGTQYPEMLLIS